MNRRQIIEESQALEKQINDLKRFLSIIEVQETIHERNWNGLKSCLRKNKTLSFLGMWDYRSRVEIEIPEFMRVEIAAKCKLWITELEDRANKLLGL